ncbi:heterokaryon incompatibility protein-domain-containing protein [Hypoxylon sp. FL1857]|nr:heterokaryon incompatibility protein-domain-containing protein [Hypoxylon sp. FL1857]
MDCDRCQNLIRLPETGGCVIIHRDLSDLVTGVRRQCWWCANILTYMQQNFERLPDSLQGHLSDITCPTESGWKFQSTARLYTNVYHSWTVNTHFWSNDGHHAVGFVKFTELMPKIGTTKYVDAVAGNTGSPQTWKYITERLQNCERNHQLCQQVSGYLPTRLIEIREENEKLHFHLALTPDRGARYVSLSHRWGIDMPLKLTSQNLHSFEVEIPQEGIPRKYIDATIIALRLEIKYIWIDSLCIIQDSDDWGLESGKMDSVYQHAYCNLAATSAINSSEGLFYRRSSLQVCAHKIHMPESEKPTTVIVYGDDSILDGLDKEPLNRRGWVLQERLLSNRNISFGRQLVYFECAEELSCEIVNKNLGNGLRIMNWFGNSLISLKNMKDMPLHDAQGFWVGIIRSYSMTSLSEPSDKLVAISGIVKSYFTNTYTAPVVGSNPYGAVQNAWIRLIGWVFPIFHKGCDLCELQQAQEAREGQEHEAKSRPFMNKVTDAICHALDGVGGSPSVGIDHCEMAETTWSHLMPIECFFLPITYRKQWYKSQVRLQLECLILAAMTPSRGVYQRIGLLTFYIHLPNEELYEDTIERYEGNPEQLMESVLPRLMQKFRRCKVPSYEGYTLERHEITLV